MSRALAGRYRLDEPLGLGGMGEVRRATDQVLGRAVAVKLVDLATTVDPATAARFAREVQATASLAHHNVVTVFDAGADGHTLSLVMELLAGLTVAGLLERAAPLEVADVVS